MITQALDTPAASLAALFGAVCAISWPFFPTRRSMLLVQIGITAGFGIHYALLGAGTAAIANLLSGLQLIASLQNSKVSGIKTFGCTLIAVMLLMSALTWSGLPSLCAVIGTVLLTYGRMQADEKRLRLWVMIGIVPWLFHDLLVGSPIAIIDAISLLSAAYTVWRPMTSARRDDVRSRAIRASAGT